MLRQIIPVVALTACVAPAGTDAHAHNVSVTMARSSEAAAVRRPFISIIDSVALVATPQGGEAIVRGVHLSGRDSTASFHVKVPDGMVRFDVSVISNSDTVLYLGTTTAKVDRDDFAVEIVPVVRTSVLVAAPESVTAPLGAAGATFVVYNRGNTIMNFFVVDTAKSHQQCTPPPCFSPRIKSARVLPADSFSVVVDSIKRFSNPIPLSFQTTQGSVAVFLRAP